jgi:mono/diheme cytochrome c family protein
MQSDYRMRPMRCFGRWLPAALAALAALTVMSVLTALPARAAAPASAPSPEQIARGRYLAGIANCAACHTK